MRLMNAILVGLALVLLLLLAAVALGPALLVMVALAGTALILWLLVRLADAARSHHSSQTGVPRVHT